MPTLLASTNAQRRALVRTVEALLAIDPSGPVERAAARVLLYAYKRRLQGVVEAALAWMAEDILSASGRIGERRAVNGSVG